MGLQYSANDTFFIVKDCVDGNAYRRMTEAEVAYFLINAVKHINAETVKGVSDKSINLIGIWIDHPTGKKAILFIPGPTKQFGILMGMDRKVCGRCALQNADLYILDKIKAS
jgi:hypothetical protein